MTPSRPLDWVAGVLRAEPTNRARQVSVIRKHGDTGCLQGFEIGSGFGGSRMLGSEHNDEFYMLDGQVRTKTNR